jgi:acyl-ACP thioesterase
MPISPNFTSILTKDWEINFLQCYPNGFLSYTELCNIIQLTAAKHSELGGISFSDMQEYHQAWVLSKIRIEIKRLPKWKDKVTIKTWINSLENSRSNRCLEVYIGDEKIVGCETFWAVINTKTRKPEALALPHEHFEKFSIYATEKRFSKIDIQNDFVEISNHTVKLSDLDIVNHANNVKYLEWCLDEISPKTIISQKIKAFEMNFMKEIGLHYEVTIYKHDDTYKIMHQDKNCFALLIE